MPDIFKGKAFVETGDCVQIPDIVFPFDAAPAEEHTAEGPEEGAAPAEKKDAPTPQPDLPKRKTRDELIAEQQSVIKEIRREAAEIAYQEALKQKRGELKDCIAEVEQQLDLLQQQQRIFLEQYSQELKYLAIDIAEKMILQKIEMDDMVLVPLVTQAIASVKNTKWLTVELSERLVSLVEHMKDEVNKAEYHGRVEIDPIACPDDTCRINSEEGVLVASVSTQADNLRALFREIEAGDELM